MQKFEDFGLSIEVLDALEKKGFEEPSDIQKLVIPELLKERTHLIGQAQTGTGKTAAFGIPILETVEADKTVKALILAPTRELANQVADEIYSLKGKKDIRVLAVYGGASIENQIKKLKSGVDIVVGTPGRVMDLMRKKVLKVNNLDYFVLDEADEMLNMGFLEDIELILEETNDEKKMLFFSATMPKAIMDIAKKFMDDYKLLKVKKQELTTDLTEQIYYEVKQEDKFEALCRVLDYTQDFYGIVFCRTKSEVDDVTNRLKARNYDAECIHGDITQGLRQKALDLFKKKVLTILVATDVAARGIDVSNLTHVINYAIPQEVESYVHRIGRTGRAGKEGTAITFITPQEYRRLLQIQKAVKKEIRKESLPEIKDIIQAKKFKIRDDVAQILIDNDYEKFKKMAKDLLKMEETENVVAALLKLTFSDVLDESNYSEISPVKMDDTGKTRLFIAMGRNDGMTPKKLVDFVIKKSKVKSAYIKNAEVYESFSFISVPFKEAEIIVEAFAENRKGKKPLIEKAKNRK